MRIAQVSSEYLKINEIFYSLQGEGLYTGCAAVFVRLAGCSMGCPWCDTKYAQKEGKLLSIEEIFEEIKKYSCPRIVITGGEPCEQNVGALLHFLKGKGFELHLETNGAIDINTEDLFCLTVSPKKNPNINMLEKADVIKCVVDNTPNSAQNALDYTKYLKSGAVFFIQPEGNKPENFEKCLELIKQNPQIRLSVQLHKLLNIK